MASTKRKRTYRIPAPSGFVVSALLLPAPHSLLRDEDTPRAKILARQWDNLYQLFMLRFRSFAQTAHASFDSEERMVSLIREMYTVKRKLQTERRTSSDHSSELPSENSLEN